MVKNMNFLDSIENFTEHQELHMNLFYIVTYVFFVNWFEFDTFFYCYLFSIINVVQFDFHGLRTGHQLRFSENTFGLHEKHIFLHINLPIHLTF